MASVILLDGGPLSMATHPQADRNQAVLAWIEQKLRQGAHVWTPEIVDYELRRELLRLQKATSAQRLDDFEERLGYVPITTAAILKAARFWATARIEGYPTAGDEALDADVILAGQAAVLSDEGHDVIVATTNVGHLARFVQAREWSEI